MKSNILYALNVPWSWIEQRPQILANKLADSFDITCISPKSLVRTVLKLERKHSDFRGESRAYYYLPSKLNHGIIRYAVGAVNKHRCYHDIDCFKCVWLSHPSQIECVPSTYDGTVVYDCMDDYVAMSCGTEKEALLQQEKRLIDRADVIFTSSEYLMRAVGKSNTVLVRNGYKQGNLQSVAEAKLQNKYTIAYFGTVSQWFDFDSIRAIVQKMNNIFIRIIGPVEVQQNIEHVDYRGSVRHQDLFDSASDCSCLIMPFKVNDIIKAVDPVKLYEYIAFGKCVLSVRYPEVERFGDYVYFYESTDELVELVNDLASRGFPPKYTEESRAAFLRNNTWENRTEMIVATLAKYGITS